MDKEYIEKSAFKALLNETIYNSCGNSKVSGLKNARDLLDVFTPADVKPVIRGKWKRIDEYVYGEKWQCTCCEETNQWRARFCPNCGADMR